MSNVMFWYGDLARGELDVDEYRRLRAVMASASDDSPTGAGSLR